ncbi:pollen receptor-like kinase 1 isoform X2 [Impatiens glandulifera]|uniref:pollen receptor-like kinase 1 isoform X2 n=1 Tax=Impatiens glandulifera TaxID=253017 RepID=UPI001FB06259|nr:pollen receptor-like kinase 1 isoform X2 [Impatiens glandulifera]
MHAAVCLRHSPMSEPEALLSFKNFLKDNGSLSSWTKSKSPCSGNKPNWVGVLCGNGRVVGLQLENLGLSGVIDVASLNHLPILRTLSFMHNNFEGILPEIKVLGAIKSIFLSHNKFSGEILPDAFTGMKSLKKVHLGYNDFTGPIPWSLSILPKLIELTLEDNKFNGYLPEFKVSKLKYLNVSYNDLQGPIPASLSTLNATSFAGNVRLCGLPLKPCSALKKLTTGMMVIVIIAVAAALSAIAVVIVILNRRKPTATDRESGQTAGNNGRELDREGSHRSTSSKRGEGGVKLTFLREDTERFDLGDLLKASAEILGSGYLGSSYKAALKSGKTMVVKRFKQMNNVGKEEFQEHMWRLGRLKHQNLLPIVAFYYRKEEKLIVSDYIPNVSLAVHLNGGQPSLDWPTRLKIIKGVAKGLQYLYNELPSLIVPCGHLKSSNVLLNEFSEPLISDYGLLPVVNLEHAQEIMVVYRSPEYKQSRRVTKKTDVWSFGILILETLTGKFPANCWQQNKGNETDLEAWVQSIVRGEGFDELFDKDMKIHKASESEAMKLLKIGLACTDSDVEKRCDFKEVLEKIDELKERDGEDDFYSSCPSDADVPSSRGISGDFSINHQS